MSGIVVERLPVAVLRRVEREAMLALMRRYYLGVDAQEFHRDLEAKTCVFLLRRPGGEIVGFSTQRLFSLTVGGHQSRLVFSGDTIIERSCRRSWLLPVAWGRWMESLRAEAKTPLYWLLISKGFRTFRFLPVFFHRFHPRDPLHPHEQALRHAASFQVGGNCYDPSVGVIAARPGGQRLHPDEAPLTEERRRDPNLDLFARANPGHAMGDELVCLAEWSPANVKTHLLNRICAPDPTHPQP